MPWGSELFQEQLELVDGNVVVPNRPGIGFTWDETAIRRFQVD
jgi:L-alanine-DL-glutamate epimerase-like enolase superfamily enzyme